MFPGWIPLRRLFGLAALIVGGMLLVRQVQQLGWDRVVNAVVRVPPGLVAGVLLLTGIRFVFWTVRWRRLLAETSSRPGFGPTLVVVLASTSIGHTLPFGRIPAGLARARLVARKTGTRTSTVYGTVLMDQFLTTSVGLLCLLAGVIFLLGTGVDTSDMPGGPWTWGILAALTLGAVVALPLLRRRRENGSVEPSSRWERLRGGFADSLSHPLDAVLGLALSAIMVAATVAAEVLVLRGFGLGLPVAAAVTAVALGGMLGAVAGSPGGLGVTEAAAIEIYAGFGVGGGEAAAAVLLTRAAHLFWVLGVGSVCLAVLGGRAAAVANDRASPVRDRRPGRRQPG